MTISTETLRLAMMAERYGTGDMLILGRAVRELHQQLSAPRPHWPCWPVEEDDAPGEPFDANDPDSKWDRCAI